MDSSPMKEKLDNIRDLIENAKPAEEYFAEHTSCQRDGSANVYQKHLDALMEEFDALVGDDYVNKNEAMSIRALVAYVAHEHKLSEAVACAIVEQQFGLEEIRMLPKQRYMEVINYLVDFDPRRIMN